MKFVGIVGSNAEQSYNRELLKFIRRHFKLKFELELLEITDIPMFNQDIDISDYDCEAYIVAIQTNGSYEVRVFNMFNETELDSRKNIIINALSELSYHYQTNNWEHTRSYYEGNGTEELE